MLETPYSTDLLTAEVQSHQVATEDPGSSEQSQDKPESDMAALRAYFTKPPLQSLGLCVT